VLERKVTIVNKLGLHARAASKLVKIANQFEAQLKIQIGERVIDGKSIMSVMLLAATQGTDMVLRTDGRDEVDAMVAVVALIDDKFGEGA
jgi:phosphotransferase system HPr (HPr) family protein